MNNKPLRSFGCRCGAKIHVWGPTFTIVCENCDRNYNGSGQLLHPNWSRNPSLYDDEISDLDGYEYMYAGDE